MTNELEQLKKLADSAKDWILSLRDTWQRSPGIWQVGLKDEEGNMYDVLTIDCGQYDRGFDSEKLALFYAAANPVAILQLIEHCESQAATIAELRKMYFQLEQSYGEMANTKPSAVDGAKPKCECKDFCEHHGRDDIELDAGTGEEYCSECADDEGSGELCRPSPRSCFPGDTKANERERGFMCPEHAAQHVTFCAESDAEDDATPQPQAASKELTSEPDVYHEMVDAICDSMTALSNALGRGELDGDGDEGSIICTRLDELTAFVTEAGITWDDEDGGLRIPASALTREAGEPAFYVLKDDAGAIMADSYDEGLPDGVETTLLRCAPDVGVWIPLYASPAQVPTPIAQPDDMQARKLYVAYVDESGMHCNRFPSWNELSEAAKDGWRKQAKDSQP
jgi:hypothetical protein